jgi:SAM-dependent methyltransferase
MPACRFCQSELKYVVVSLGKSPLSNSYLSEKQLHQTEPFYPLEVYVCEKCFLVQVEEVVSPKDIFSSNYAYYSSYSESWLQHCKEYTEMMINRFGFDNNSLVVEIGSNDGYLLQYFKHLNIPVLGIEPASNTAEQAKKIGIPTDIAFFDVSFAKRMKETDKLTDLIIGNNVLAHNPNLNDFVEGLRIALKSNGVITMEFPHLLQLMEYNQFDTIYHEHFSYFSFLTVEKVFATHGLIIFDVEELPTHGGSLRIYARHQEDNTKPISERVYGLKQQEIDDGYEDINHYLTFGEKVKKTKRDILSFLIQAKEEGKTIVGYGAPAKGNTLLNYCGIKTDFIDYTVDKNPYKQGRYLPGSHIPIEVPDKIKGTKPDYLFILPWNLKDEIMEQMAFIRGWGGKFVIPIPKVMVL